MKYLALLLLSASVAFGQSLTNTTLDGVTNATLNGVLDNDAAATRTAIGLGTAATADSSTTGGANKIPQFDSNGMLRVGPINTTSAEVVGGGSLRIPAWQKLQFEDNAGGVSGHIYNFNTHWGAYIPNAPEMILQQARVCFYWDDGMQIGNADVARGSRYIYIRNNGTATALDQVHESNPLTFAGSWWNGSAARQTHIGVQWVPSGIMEGEFQFWVSDLVYPHQTGGRLSSAGNVVSESGISPFKVFSVAHTGPKIATDKVLTFGDGTTLASTSDVTALAEAAIPADRVGRATLVAGTLAVADASVTAYTDVLLTRKVTGGTVGHLSYTKNPGTGFTINSTSASETSVISYLLIENTVSDSAPPTIAGTTEIGDTLTVTTGGGGAAYQWYSGATLVSGQTASTYVIRPADIGAAITCQEGGTPSNAITAWHPDDETGYYADYRNDAGLYQTNGGAAATANADPVGQWQDQSGNGRNLNQSTDGYRPLLDTATDSGYPFLSFDGTNDSLAITTAATLPLTVFIAAHTTYATANEFLLTTNGSGVRLSMRPQSGNQIDNTSATITSWTNATKGIVTARATSVLLGIRTNAGSEATGAATPSNMASINIGGTSTSYNVQCRVYGALFYNADLDSAAQARVRKYLKAKYGTP